MVDPPSSLKIVHFVDLGSTDAHLLCSQQHPYIANDPTLSISGKKCSIPETSLNEEEETIMEVEDSAITVKEDSR